MSALSIENLSVRYGTGSERFQALRDVSVQVGSGTFVTLLGPSGSGKTTLLRCIAGLLSPTAGRIVAGERLFYDAATSVGLPTRHRNLGMVFQAFALWPHMSVAENIAFPLRMRGWAKERRRTRVDELLTLVGLPGLGARHPNQLSGGQQQRVGLARAIACEPSLLLMDEPLSSLDARLREEMRSYIRGLQKELGITVIYVTHDREEALGLSDVIVILSGGTLVATGTARGLYQDPPDSFTAMFLAGWNLLGHVDQLSAHAEGSWLKDIARTSPCHCGNHCAILLPVEFAASPGPTSVANDPQVPGEVANVEFLGSAVRMELRLPGVERPVFVTRTGEHADAALQLDRGAEVALPLRAFRVLCEPQRAQAQKQGGM